MININTIYGTSLVRTYFASFDSVAAGLRYLNENLGTNYQHGHKSRWERGEREPCRGARAAMLRRILPGVLKAHGEATEDDIRLALEKLL